MGGLGHRINNYNALVPVGKSFGITEGANINLCSRRNLPTRLKKHFLDKIAEAGMLTLRKHEFVNYKAIILSLLIVFEIFFFCSCAMKSPMLREQELMNKMAIQSPYSFVKKGFAGIDFLINEKKEVEIYEVYSGTPAYYAKIEPGDIILEVNSVAIKNKGQLFDIYDSMYPNDTITLKINRKGQELQKSLILSVYNYPNDFYVLMEMIYKDNSVRLAVLPGDIQIMYPVEANLLNEWKKSVGIRLIGSAESTYINFFRKQKNFIMIDRHQTDKLLSEMQFQQSGLILDEYRKKIGKLLGATHIVTVNLTRSILAGSKHEDMMTRRLIEVESGKVLATFSIRLL